MLMSFEFLQVVLKLAITMYIDNGESEDVTDAVEKLITERRLFGGEEVIIGETFFRFRIM